MQESGFSPHVPDGRYDVSIAGIDYENVTVRDGVAYLITHYMDGTFSCFMPYADPTSMTLTRVDLFARIAKSRRDGEPVVYGRVASGDNKEGGTSLEDPAPGDGQAGK